MTINLKEFLNKKVMVRLFNGQIQTGVILRNPDEGLFRFQYSTVESKSDDSYSGYYGETMLLSRTYVEDGAYIPNRLGGYSNHSWNIVDIQLMEEPVTSKCCYNDCGWCYAPSHINNNAVNGACKNPNECPTLNFETEETMYPKQPKPINMVEIETKRWAEALSNFIDKHGGDSPALWEWGGITPTPEKVVECLQELVDFHMTIAADNELDECCELISKRYSGCTYQGQDIAKDISTWMRNTRRPKPTLKSQALKDFETVRKHSDLLPEILDTIENALKSIPE
jgi:hypothetical protein